jgi:hypothetical protein
LLGAPRDEGRGGIGPQLLFRARHR